MKQTSKADPKRAASTPDKQEVASQLRCPHGPLGVAFGQAMNLRNLPMILGALAQLDISAGDRLLESGCGNGGLLGYILSQATGLHYTGHETSRTMIDEALAFNAPFIQAGRASYVHGDGRVLPFADACFDKALSVNTVYFWEDPARMLAEFSRVLRPGGCLCLTFSEKAFMAQLSFAQYGFRLFEAADIEALAAKLPLQRLALVRQQDLAVSKDGQLLERPFVHLVFRKQAEPAELPAPA